MRELEPSLQQFGEFSLKAQLVRPAAAPYFVRWVRRFLDYAAQQQEVPHPRVESEVVRDDLAHLAVRQRVSASTQNQAFCAILFLRREVMGLNVEGVSPGVKAKRGERLPVVLSMPGLAGVWMPDALDRKYPNAGRELGRFWVFPSRTLSTDPRAGVVRRHHVSDSVIQKAVKAAAQEARIHKPLSTSSTSARGRDEATGCSAGQDRNAWTTLR